MPNATTWSCDHCDEPDISADAVVCPKCYHGRYANWSIQFSTHITEHLADGLTEPLQILEAMAARPCYQRFLASLTLELVARYVRLLTKDTTALARQLVKARSASVMLHVLEYGDANTKLRVLEKYGPETNAEHVDTKSETVTRHVVHIHEGPPPAREP